MTSELRKIHKIIWLMLIVVVPILIFLSVLGIEKSLLTDGDLSTEISIQNQHIILENDELTIGLEKQNSAYKLRVILKRPLKSPAPIIYGTSSTNTDIYLGVLDKKGIYTFNVERSLTGIKIYDGLKKEDIIKIEQLWD